MPTDDLSFEGPQPTPQERAAIAAAVATLDASATTRSGSSWRAMARSEAVRSTHRSRRER